MSRDMNFYIAVGAVIPDPEPLFNAFLMKYMVTIWHQYYLIMFLPILFNESYSEILNTN